MAASVALEIENKERREQALNAQSLAKRALRSMDDAALNTREIKSCKKQYTKQDDYTRGVKSRGGVDGYRHRNEALKKVVPWIKKLKDSGRKLLLLEDGAPAHTSKIAQDYLTVSFIDKLLWPGHSLEINALEHAWPWIRRQLTKDFYPSKDELDCRSQWECEWDSLPQEVINKWIDYIPEVVRRIIDYGGKNDFHDG
jgi:hypothetical protein